MTSTSSISTALSSSSAAPAVSSSAAPNGPDCGQIGADGNGSVVRLVITGGTLSCAEAKKVWTDYGSAAKEGSGGFATVDDAWQCAHGSVADLQQTGVQGGCQNGQKAFETRISSLSGGPSGGASGSSSASAANGAPAGCTASSKGQLTGSELAAILACISSFPTGASATLHTADSGSQLVPQPTDPGQLYRSASCVDNATLPDFSVLGTAYARREYAVTSAFSATVDQFQDNATASAFLGDRRAYVQRCAASQFPGSAWQATSAGGLPGVLFTMPGLREVIIVDGTELIDVSANTPANQSPATSTAPEKVAADIVAAFSH
ncbi:MAG: hypothetical protein HOW97_22855 [Catenulispora sp.]|nr:hypothetical protein [Catenulispora sp.]